MVPARLAALVDRAVRRSGHERLRQLLDPAHPAYDPRYEVTALRLAGLGPPRAPARPPPDPRHALVADCPHRDLGGRLGCCHGQLARCKAGRGDAEGIVDLADCLACISAPTSRSP